LKWSVYILKCKDRCLYTGITTDPKRRFEEHRSGKGGSFTRAHKPVRIVYIEEMKSRSRALRREAQIKKMARNKKLDLIISAIGGPASGGERGN
jgi:putative endonuclease